jgi:hypothetical protein
MEKHRQARPGNRVSRLLALGCASVAVFGMNTVVVHAEPATHRTGTEKFDRQMQPILDGYLQIGSALASDSLDGVQQRAEAIAKHAAALDPSVVTGEHEAHYKKVPENLKKAAQALSRAETLTGARDTFRKLSQPMAMWATMSKPKNIDVLYCSMSKASWVQKHGKVRNPYHGAKMLECGELVGGESYENPKR